MTLLLQGLPHVNASLLNHSFPPIIYLTHHLLNLPRLCLLSFPPSPFVTGSSLKMLHWSTYWQPPHSYANRELFIWRQVQVEEKKKSKKTHTCRRKLTNLDNQRDVCKYGNEGWLGARSGWQLRHDLLTQVTTQIAPFSRTAPTSPQGLDCFLEKQHVYVCVCVCVGVGVSKGEEESEKDKERQEAESEAVFYHPPPLTRGLYLAEILDGSDCPIQIYPKRPLDEECWNWLGTVTQCVIF